MKKVFFVFIITSFVFSLMACMSTQAVRLGSSFRVPVPLAQVFVYRTADDVPGDYEEVALISSGGSGVWGLGVSEKKIWKAMRKKAGSLGANGIILDSMSHPTTGAKVVSALIGIGAKRKGKAIAIYVHPEKK